MANILLDRTVRLAVTGLSGAGKTVFITSVLHNLLSAAHAPAILPLFGVKARGALIAAQIVPGASLSRKLFPYAEAVAAMAGDPPAWPEGTRDISQIRIAIRYRPEGLVGRQLGLATLNLDIIDYPGEWLIDLPMLDQSFADWSAAMLTLCRAEPRRSLAAEWLGFVERLSADAPADEAAARQAAALYTAFLHRCREPRHGLSLVQPGRFVLPGEYAGAPILWFCPLDAPADTTPRPGSLRALMETRFEAYRREIVRRFYREHFRTFDRQVVLVDVLKALDGGRHAFEDARAALTAILGSFRFGKAGWLAPLLGSRIDRVLFAATKADHVTPDQYPNLRSLLAEM
ncbi:MAG TPA: YcjX family protein, partial [Alphaproteobacteria bacterium]|nr:YcjX family protein [Alphaproteobacteria bacterium]